MARTTNDAANGLIPTASDRLEDAAAALGARAQAARLSEQIGEEVRPIDPAWRRFAQEGMVIEVHVSRERFKLRMERADLGIEFEDKTTAEQVDQILAPGHIYMIPKDDARRIERLEELARENLRRRGFKTFWGTWVHTKNFRKWKQGEPVVEGAERQNRDRGNDELRALFEAERDSLIERYDELVAAAQIGWRSLAISNWERLRGTPVARAIPNFEDQDAWVKEQMAKMSARLPTVEKIRRKFDYRHDAYMIPTQEQIQIDLIRAGDRTLEAAQREMLSDLEASARRKVRGGVDQFMTEVRAQIQAQVFEAVAAALKVVRNRDGKIGRNSSVALQEMLDSVEDLVFWDESGAFAANLGELRRILGTPNKQRDGKDLERVLTTLGAEARLTLMDLDVERARMGLDDDDDDEGGLSRQVLSDKARGLADELGFVEDAAVLQQLVRRPSDVEADGFDDDDEGPEPAVRRAGPRAEDDFDDDGGEPGTETSLSRRAIPA